jgi:hypothetical protein
VSEEISLKQDEMQMLGTCKWLGPKKYCPEWFYGDICRIETFGCKRTANTMFGTVDLPWPVCIPLNAPVNLRPDYPNYGPASGNYSSLVECKAACQ